VNINLGISFGVAASGRGLTINTIERNSVFFDSGLRRGDVIISVYGRPVRSEVDFVTIVRNQPGARIPVIVLRDGREETIYITYDEEVIQSEESVVYDQGAGGPGFLGVMFDTQFPNAAVIRSVLPDSPAAQAGLRAGDEIVALNGEEVSSYPDAVEMIGTMQAGEPLSIAFMRPAEHQTEALLAPRAATGVRTANRPIDGGAGTVPPVIDRPRYVEPDPAFRPAPDNRGRILDQPNRPRRLLSPLRN
jgi:S1-C subfamily serine protease